MKRYFLKILMFIPVLLISSCATGLVRSNELVEPLPIRTAIYPATTLDVAYIMLPISMPIISAASENYTLKDEGNRTSYVMGIMFYPFVLIGGAIDLPVSLISDTFYLPRDLLCTDDDQEIIVSDQPSEVVRQSE